MGVLLRNMGNYEEAENYFRRALEGRTKVLGETHEDTLFTAYCLASVLNHMERYVEAEKVCRKALDIRSQLEEPDYGDIGNTQLLLADILANTDQEKEALKMAKAAKKSYKITEEEELVGKADELIKEIQSSVESKRA
jgi:tetratricopeptide (TPR) repeat protein